MDDTIALLPCPCCGGKAEFQYDESEWQWIECSSCGLCTNQRVSAMEDCRPLLAEAWNMRWSPAPKAQSSEDARDAARYQFIKNMNEAWMIDRVVDVLNVEADQFDAAIDAAMLAAQSASAGENK